MEGEADRARLMLELARQETQVLWLTHALAPDSWRQFFKFSSVLVRTAPRARSALYPRLHSLLADQLSAKFSQPDRMLKLAVCMMLTTRIPDTYHQMLLAI